MSGIEPSSLILSVNRALWGEVGPALRRVSVNERDRRISLQFYFDGPISEADAESASVVGTEVVSDFPAATIAEDLIRCDAPAPIVLEDGWRLVYQRREPT